jgi:hypothetical protein
MNTLKTKKIGLKQMVSFKNPTAFSNVSDSIRI